MLTQGNKALFFAGVFITGAYCGCYIARSFREHLFVQAFLAVMLLQTMPRTREVADTGARPLLLAVAIVGSGVSLAVVHAARCTMWRRAADRAAGRAGRPAAGRNDETEARRAAPEWARPGRAEYLIMALGGLVTAREILHKSLPPVWGAEGMAFAPVSISFAIFGVVLAGVALRNWAAWRQNMDVSSFVFCFLTLGMLPTSVAVSLNLPFYTKENSPKELGVNIPHLLAVATALVWLAGVLLIPFILFGAKQIDNYLLPAYQWPAKLSAGERQDCIAKRKEILGKHCKREASQDSAEHFFVDCSACCIVTAMARGTSFSRSALHTMTGTYLPCHYRGSHRDSSSCERPPFV